MAHHFENHVLLYLTRAYRSVAMAYGYSPGRRPGVVKLLKVGLGARNCKMLAALSFDVFTPKERTCKCGWETLSTFMGPRNGVLAYIRNFHLAFATIKTCIFTGFHCFLDRPISLEIRCRTMKGGGKD
jgi:hypothetical protein